MIYFATPSAPQVREAMRAGLLGMIRTPAQGNLPVQGARWCADNGCFGDGWPGDAAWLSWLCSFDPAACAFAVAPDVVADAKATLARSAPYLPVIRGLGFPAAYVAQNGIEDTAVPWEDFDVLFLGGDTPFKLGPVARSYAAEAHAYGKRVHMGRVNSLRRLRYAAAIGCDSADGTFLTFGPDRRLPELLGWLRDVNGQGVLWEATA